MEDLTPFQWSLTAAGLGAAALAIWRPNLISFLAAGLVNLVALLVRFV